MPFHEIVCMAHSLKSFTVLLSIAMSERLASVSSKIVPYCPTLSYFSSVNICCHYLEYIQTHLKMAPLALCLLTYQFFFRVHITTSLDIILYFLPLDWKLYKDRDKALFILMSLYSRRTLSNVGTHKGLTKNQYVCSFAVLGRIRRWETTHL